MAGFMTAGFVQAVSGFGSGMVAMAILPMALPVTDVVPVVNVFGASICSMILFSLRHK